MTPDLLIAVAMLCASRNDFKTQECQKYLLSCMITEQFESNLPTIESAAPICLEKTSEELKKYGRKRR